jgi:hypothetical protein
LRHGEESIGEEGKGRGKAMERRGKGEGEGDVEEGRTKTTKDKRKPHVSAHLNGLYNFMNAKRLVRNKNFTSSESKCMHVNIKKQHLIDKAKQVQNKTRTWAKNRITYLEEISLKRENESLVSKNATLAVF